MRWATTSPPRRPWSECGIELRHGACDHLSELPAARPYVWARVVRRLSVARVITDEPRPRCLLLARRGPRARPVLSAACLATRVGSGHAEEARTTHRGVGRPADHVVKAVIPTDERWPQASDYVRFAHASSQTFSDGDISSSPSTPAAPSHVTAPCCDEFHARVPASVLFCPTRTARARCRAGWRAPRLTTRGSDARPSRQALASGLA